MRDVTMLTLMINEEMRRASEKKIVDEDPKARGSDLFYVNKQMWNFFGLGERHCGVIDNVGHRKLFDSLQNKVLVRN